MILSYAGPDLSAGRRALVRCVERLTGGGTFRRAHERYERARHDPHDTRPFNSRAIEALRLELTPRFDAPIPATGGLLLVSNHPMGPLDGLAIAASIERVRQDVRTVIWDTIDIPPHARAHFLPLDLSDTTVRARRQNVAMRRETIAHLRAGGAVLLFPAGAAEITRHPFAAPEEAPWTPLALNLARGADVPVLPVFVEAHNSRLFHVASHLGSTARRALYIRETTRRIGGAIGLRFGCPVTVAELEAAADAVANAVPDAVPGAEPGAVPGAEPGAVPGAERRVAQARDRTLTARLRAMTLALGARTRSA